jgi:hypothetical protein
MVDVDDDDKSGVRVWGELVRPVTAARTERDSMLFSLDNQCRRKKSEWGGMVVVMMRTRGEMVDEHYTSLCISTTCL